MNEKDKSKDPNSELLTGISRATPENISDEENHRHDGLTEIIGSIGRWQLTITLLLDISVAVHAWQMMANKWLLFPVDHWCARPEGMTDMSVEEWRNLSAPMLSDGSYDKCNVYQVDYDTISERPPNDTSTIPCSDWEYDHSMFQVIQN